MLLLSFPAAVRHKKRKIISQKMEENTKSISAPRNLVSVFELKFIEVENETSTDHTHH